LIFIFFNFYFFKLKYSIDFSTDLSVFESWCWYLFFLSPSSLSLSFPLILIWMTSWNLSEERCNTNTIGFNISAFFSEIECITNSNGFNLSGSFRWKIKITFIIEIFNLIKFWKNLFIDITSLLENSTTVMTIYMDYLIYIVCIL